METVCRLRPSAALVFFILCNGTVLCYWHALWTARRAVSRKLYARSKASLWSKRNRDDELNTRQGSHNVCDDISTCAASVYISMRLDGCVSCAL